MIVGDPNNVRKCPHSQNDCDGIDDLYVFCHTCRRIVSVVSRSKVPISNKVERRLPRPRLDSFSEFEENALEFN